MDCSAYGNGTQKKGEACHVLVIGGAGYIGAALVPLLLKVGYKVTVFDLCRWGVSSCLSFVDDENFHIIQGDIRDRDALAKAMEEKDVVIHLAAIVGYPACDKDTNLATEVNVQGTKNVTELLTLRQKLIYASSVCCYGANDGVCSEETPLTAQSHYAKTKAEGEKYSLAVGGVALRVASLFGVSPRMRLDELINSLVFNALSEKMISLYEGHVLRTFLHVKDAARAFVFAIQNFHAMKGQVYNAGDERLNVSKFDASSIIKSQIDGCRITLTDGGDPDKKDYEVSYKKISALGYRSTISLEQGIRDLIQIMPCMSNTEIATASDISPE